MEEIILKQVHKNNQAITFDFSVSDGLCAYFSGKPFVIEYPENIESVPDAVAAIPFVCNVLPIIWLTDSVLRIPELDKLFCDCIPNVKQGYETMFPESTFAGTLEVARIVPCHVSADCRSATFFSGGLDAVNTLICHLDEKPDLISVWGSDIEFNNELGWKVVHRGIQEYAEKYHLSDVVIRSSFRDFDNEQELHHRFCDQLKDGWWHGVKHGIGLLGHAAPYAYLHGISTVYIASSNCPADGPVRCASNPLIDNHVRFANARVVHDGFHFSRQDKIHNVVEYVQKSGDQLSLHVCWESQSGSNCCRCEKCYRTMAGLIAEGTDALEYGFPQSHHTISSMREFLIGHRKLSTFLSQTQWVHIQKRMVENSSAVRMLPYWRDVRWMLNADFMHPERIRMPFIYRLKRYLARFRFYQFLRKLRAKVRGARNG